mmetsp:Transcript_19670/g.20385  ORF Transcript_19670/g.20385 Transcript_19670/m.20385 type:complete len:97 (-) Transcript_19670:227-517(-)
MKVRSAVRIMCKDCYLVRRKRKLFCYCKSNPRHKQRQGYHSSIPSSSSSSIPSIPSPISSPFSSSLTMFNSTCSISNNFTPIRYGLGASSFFIRGI